MRIIRRTVAEALDELSRNPKELLRVAAIPGALVVTQGVWPLLARHFWPPNDLLQFHLVWTTVIGLMGYIVLAFQVYRYILCKDSQSLVQTQLSDFMHYLMWCSAIILLCGIAWVIAFFAMSKIVLSLEFGFSSFSAFVIAVLVLLCSILFTYFVLRISLILPNRSAGRRESLAQIWKMSDGNGWKLTGVLLVPPVLIGMFVTQASSVLGKDMSVLIIAILNFPMAVFTIAIQAVAYRRLLSCRASDVEP